VNEDYLQEEWDISLADLDNEVSPFAAEQQWEHSRSPTAQAFTTLQKYEDQLGPELFDDEDEFGSIDFNRFSHPGSDDRWVEVSCPAGLSCLQYRLNALNAGIKIEVSPE